jgi:hypothetical protein
MTLVDGNKPKIPVDPPLIVVNVPDHDGSSGSEVVPLPVSRLF